MKFKTFRALLIGAGILAGGGLLVLIVSSIINFNNSAKLRHAQALATVDGDNVESQLLGMLGKPAGGKTKIKDLRSNGPTKINVYADRGVWARAKVDLDRDERWDQKWRWEAGVVYRSVATADDENYGPEQVVGGAPNQVAAVAEVAVPTPTAPTTPTTPTTIQADGQLRDIDELMLVLLTRPVQAKIKDASKGRPFKINLYSDDGLRFNRAKVDIDRDDHWDESWTFTSDGSIERKVSPADDEQYTARYVLEAGVRWQPAP